MSRISITNSGQSFQFSKEINAQSITCTTLQTETLVVPSNYPEDPVVGTSYFDTEEDEFRIYNGDDWISTPGPQGPQGANGQDGSSGNSGSDGANGKQGPSGVEQFTYNVISNFGGSSVTDFNERYFRGYSEHPIIGIAMSSDGQYQYAAAKSLTDPYFAYIRISSNYGASFLNYYYDDRWTSIACSADGQIVVASTDTNKLYIMRIEYSNATIYTLSVSFNSIAVSATGQYMSGSVYGGKIWRSSNYGVTWTQVSSIATANYNEVSMSGAGDIQIAVAGDRNGPGAAYLSTDFGVTWTLITGTGKPITAEPGFCSVKVSTNGKYATILASLGYIYVSNDFGTSWVTSNESIGNQTNIAMSANGQYQAYVNADNSNIYYSTNYGTTFTQNTAFTIPNRITYGRYPILLSSSGKQLFIAANSDTMYNWQNAITKYEPFFDAPSSTLYMYNGTSWVSTQLLS